MHTNRDSTLASYLDDELDPTARTDFESRAARDPALARELRGHRAVQAALEGLARDPDPSAIPPRGFAAGVLIALHARPNWIERLRDWLARDPAASDSAFDALLDNRLSRRQTRILQSLAERDPAVAQALRRWRLVRSELAGLPVLAPSERLAGQVMAQVRRAEAAEAPTALGGRAQESGRRMSRLALTGWLRTIRSNRRERLAAASGIAFGPAATMAGTLYLVFSNHPQLTLPGLASFAWSRASEAVAAVGAGLREPVWNLASTSMAARSDLAAVLPLGVGALLALAGLMAASLWILYRNVAPHREREGRRVVT